MKKTSQLSIGGSLFNIEQDAFERLESYTNSIREHFMDNPEKEEILRDIEGRIAENFSEVKSQIITLKEVESIIETIGTVEQFDGEVSNGKGGKTVPSKKQLFRDKDNAMLAGVASGLEHFFGVNVIIIRILFILFVIFGGPAGVLIYMILMLVVPEAKTPSQKLAMRGDPVTLSAVAEVIKERINEVGTPQKRGVVAELLSSFIDVLRRIIEMLAPFVRIGIGLLILVASSLLIITVTTGTSSALFFMSPKVIDGPLITVAQSLTAKILLLGIYTLIIVPLIFGLILGINVLTKRNYISKLTGSVLLSVWSIAMVVFFVAGPITLAKIDKILLNDPYYKIETRVIETGTFQTVTVTGNTAVKIVQGKDYQVKLQGRAYAMDRVRTSNQNGVLTVREEMVLSNSFLRCDVCVHPSAEIVIVAPDISTIIVNDSSYVDGTLETKELQVHMNDSSDADLYLTAEVLDVSLFDSSKLELSGNIKHVKADIKNSSEYLANRLKTEMTELYIIDSSKAEVYATKVLKAIVSNDAFVSYLGHPDINKEIDDTSSLVSKNEEVGESTTE